MSRKRRTVADEPFLVIRTTQGPVKAGQRVNDHNHGWHQLASVSAGLMTVRTEAGSWVAPPRWAIWIPAEVRHDIRFVCDSIMESLYVRPGAFAVPEKCTALAVSPLLRELILRAADIGMLDSRDPVETALATLIAAEFTQADVPPFTLPQPTSHPTRLAAAMMADGDARADNLTSLARAVGQSLRTLERQFLDETRMTIGQWRRHQALLRGLESLAAGDTIKGATDVAGYAAPSAFIAAFGKAFGTTPGRYFARPLSELAEAP